MGSTSFFGLSCPNLLLVFLNLLFLGNRYIFFRKCWNFLDSFSGMHGDRRQGNIHFPCSADHEQDWLPYPIDPYSGYM